MGGVCGHRDARTQDFPADGDDRGERGQYELVRTYDYVGENRGDYEKEVTLVHLGYKLRNWVLACVGCSILLAILGTAFLIHAAQQGDAFDCDTGLDHWRHQLSNEQKSWCCKNKGKGCLPDPQEPHPYCQAGIENWRQQWTAQKKDWCCKHVGVKCASTSTSSAPFDCKVGQTNWQQGWSSVKKGWCCQHYGLGCPITSTSAPFDCNADPAGHGTGWSRGQRAWCCRHEGVGCPTTTFFPYDCNSAAHMTAKKAQWCCKNMGTFCPVQASTSAPPSDHKLRRLGADWHGRGTPAA
mmetsp:Transcript_8576/g.19520  ORF Transcript_8576/g.19520 Transcript_8576/m.19520 type:complete len:296 (-) Transcript_8576:148-1035(-)